MKVNTPYCFALLASICFACLTNACEAQASAKLKNDSIQIQFALDGFLTAFRNLNWEKFVGYFSEDATAFFPPSANHPSRANNKKEVEDVFKLVFANFKTHGLSQLSILPKDYKMQVLDSNTAIVSFHLEDPGLFGRRTIVFHKINDNWLIVHLHASGVSSN